MLRGGVCKEDRWFVLELLRLDFHLCDLSFDRHRSGSEKGVHPLAPPASWHPRLLGTRSILVNVECDICVLFFAGIGASWRMASLEVVVPWTICISSNSVGFGLLFCVHRLCF